MMLAGAARAQAALPEELDWPGFRGPDADGTVASRVFDDAGNFALDVAWKRSIGSGYSGIAVGDDVVVTMFSDGSIDVVAAFDPDDGTERWRVALGPTYKGHDGSYDGPTSTPLVHQGRVFALSPRGRFVAVDTAGGTIDWELDLVEDLGAAVPLYSFATSPLIEQGVLVLQVGAPGAAIAGFDPASGKLLWTAGDDVISYQSPVPMTIGGRPQVVGVGLNRMFGIDPRSGDLLWSMDHGGSGYLGAQSLVPVPAGDDRAFLAFRDDASTVLALDPADTAGGTRQLWQNRTIRNSFSVAVYRDGVVYGFSSRFLAAVDAATGATAWKSRAPGDGFPVVVGNHLVIVTKGGGVHVIEASREGYHELAGVQVFDDIAWTPPAFAHGAVFARSMGELARVDVRPGADVAAHVRYADGVAPPGSAFAAFLERLAGSEDKASTIDGYLAGQASFPLVEGDELVHFVYRGPGSDLALAGDVIGSRREVRMHQVEGTDLFYFSAALEPDARINYHFIRDYEEIVDPRNPRTTGSAFYGDGMDLSYDGSVMPMSWLAMPRWEPPSHLADPPAGTPRGRVVQLTFDSAAMGGERSASVYLPPSYDRGDERYPVVYFHGGGPALALGEIPKSLDNLIAAGRPPLIAVFLPPTGYTGLSQPIVEAYDRYARMWNDEVVPLVDRTFRTIASSAGRANIGGGSMGYVAAYVTVRHPGTVDKLAILSPAFNDRRAELLEQWIRDADAQPLDIYHEWGLYDARAAHENWDNRDKNRRLAGYLRQRGYTLVGGEVHDGTGWSSWKNRTGRVLNTLFPR